MKRLNIFVDETGEFGFGKESSKIYGVSFTFHEHDNNIKNQINALNKRLSNIGYTEMIHMADLVSNRKEYKTLGIEKRKRVFYSIYEFSKRVKVKYHTILIDKTYTDNKRTLKNKLIKEINDMVNSNIDYFSRFEKIVMYYDDGQEDLSTILESIFYRFDGFFHNSEFDHVEKRLFQVSDMLTYIDKIQYKHKNGIKLTNNESFFFTKNDIRRIIKELDKKRF